jgi:hypothetical protein
MADIDRGSDSDRLAGYILDQDGGFVPLPDPPKPARCEDCGISLARHSAECGLEAWDDRGPRYTDWVET